MAEKSKKHAQFVSNALEDMKKKQNQKQEELQRELAASTYMIRKAQKAQGIYPSLYTSDF